MSKLLSVCVASYNAAVYLPRCINSMLDESINKDIEILVIDDGSTDNTIEVMQEFINKYKDTVKLISKKNGGHGSTINSALEIAKGKYFKAVDADDWVDTDGFVELVTYLKKNDVDLIHTNYNRVDMVTGSSFKVNDGMINYGKIYSFKDIINNPEAYFSIHSITYKTDVMRKSNLKLDEHCFYVDVEYQLIPLKYVKTIVNLDLYVYKYMVGNVNQSVSTNSMVKRYENHERVVKRSLEEINKFNDNPDLMYYAKHIMKQVINTNYNICCFYNEDTEDGKRKASEFDKYFYENYPILYDEFMKEHRGIKLCKKFGFDGKKMSSSFMFKFINKIRSILR